MYPLCEQEAMGGRWVWQMIERTSSGGEGNGVKVWVMV